MNSLNEQSEIFNENLKRTTDLMLLEARKRGASAEELARIEIDSEKAKLEELKNNEPEEELALQGIESAGKLKHKKNMLQNYRKHQKYDNKSLFERL